MLLHLTSMHNCFRSQTDHRQISCMTILVAADAVAGEKRDTSIGELYRLAWNNAESKQYWLLELFVPLWAIEKGHHISAIVPRVVWFSLLYQGDKKWMSQGNKSNQRCRLDP